jgi:hypothetical protein
MLRVYTLDFIIYTRKPVTQLESFSSRERLVKLLS